MENQETRETLETMEKEDLLEMINLLQEEIESLKIQLSSRKKGRKQEVYDILKSEGPLNISQIAKKLGITTKNVSSQLTYLKSDGVKIFTDDNGKKFIHD